MGATNPTGITYDGTNLWVSYTNDAAPNGSSGSSLIVEYSLKGVVENTYVVPGDVEGLKWWSTEGVVWALQNPMGNPTITVIHPGAGIGASSPLHFANPSSTRGYADALFLGTKAYLSYTAPVNPTDATIQQVTSTTAPLTVSTVLEMNATGTNIATGGTGKATTQTDPHSLRATPTGGIMMSSAKNGQIIYVTSPGPSQTVSFLNVLNAVSQNVTGLNDLLYNTSTSGAFFVADTGNNQIVAIQATGLTNDSLYGTIASLFAFALIDPTTGTVTEIVSSFSNPNGLAFVGN